jgi:hypothetical protein
MSLGYAYYYLKAHFHSSKLLHSDAYPGPKLVDTDHDMVF